MVQIKIEYDTFSSSPTEFQLTLPYEISIYKLKSFMSSKKNVPMDILNERNEHENKLTTKGINFA